MAKKFIQILAPSCQKILKMEQQEKLLVEKQYKQLFGENLKDSLMEPMDFDETYEDNLEELNT